MKISFPLGWVPSEKKRGEGNKVKSVDGEVEKLELLGIAVGNVKWCRSLWRSVFLKKYGIII